MNATATKPDSTPPTRKRGAEEIIRYLLRYGGDKLGKLKEHIERWLKMIEEGQPPFDAHHMVTVARSIGNVLGLIAHDHWLDAQLETYALIIYDIVKYAERWYKETDKEKKMEMLVDLKKNVLEYYFSSFEKVVADNGGHFGKKLTWLDIFFVGAIEVLEFYLGINIMHGKYPALLALATKILELPEIKDYIGERNEKESIK